VNGLESQVVIGRYFNQQGNSLYCYVQCDKGEAYIFSHLIKVMKFKMVQSFQRHKGGKPIFQLSKVVFLEIQYVIQNEENE
jgi:hypothetical protein